MNKNLLSDSILIRKPRKDYSLQKGGYLAGWLLQPLPQINQPTQYYQKLSESDKIILGKITSNVESRRQIEEDNQTVEDRFMSSTKLQFPRNSNSSVEHSIPEKWLLSGSRVYQLSTINPENVSFKQLQYFKMHETTDLNMIERFIQVIEFQSYQIDQQNELFKMFEDSFK